ncbi:MAG: hypothetical protein KTR31_30515 [Myxococcales bacterium]|nr:hypothetical protein [Myxococcales bacterium]
MTPSLLGTLILAAHAAPLDPTTFDSIAPLLDPDDTVFVDTSGDVPVLQYGETVLDGVRDSTGTLAVFTFDEVVIDEDVLVGGDRPLVILSKGDLTLSATLVVSADGVVAGPGGAYGGLDLGDDGDGAGGGVGNDTGAGGGGFGGPGGASEYGTPGGSAVGDLRKQLTGGSGGGRSSGGIFTGVGGGGGGAVEIGASGELVIDASAQILARGAAGSNGSDGAGGGSGGGVLLHGLGGRCEGTIDASGGDGSYDGCVWPFVCPDGGGGGGGQVVIDGLRSNACTVDVSGGGPFSDDPKVIDPSTGGEGLVDVALDPDFDGDGFSVGQGDCNDSNAGIYPGAKERICNQVDEDCDEATPDQPDADGDGVIACNECDDADPLRFPGNPEVLCDGIDNDCNDETADDPGDCDRIGTGQTPDSPRSDGPSDEELSTGCSCSSGPSGAALPALAWLSLLAFRRRRSVR